MNQRLAFLIAIFLLSFSSPLCAERTPVQLGLNEVLRLAAEQNPSAVIARDTVQQVIAKINDKKSILYPQVTADISGRRRTTDLRSSGITFANAGDPLIGPYDTFDARVKVTQKLFDSEFKNRLDWLYEGKGVSEAQAEKVRQDILALAAAQYVQAVRSRQMLALVRAELRRSYHQLLIINGQFHAGTATDVELRQSQVRYLQALQQGRDARREFIRARMDLAAMLGLKPDQRMILEEWNAEAFSEDAAGEKDQSADVRLAQAKLRQSKQLIASERSERWPKVLIGGDYGAAGESPSSEDSSETYALFVEASISVFDAGARKNRVKSAELEQTMNEIALHDVKRRNDADIAVNRQWMADARAAIHQADQQQRLVRRQLEVARRQFELGSGSELEVLSSRVMMAKAVDQRHEAEALYLMAAVNLAHATGNLDHLFIDKFQDPSIK